MNKRASSQEGAHYLGLGRREKRAGSRLSNSVPTLSTSHECALGA